LVREKTRRLELLTGTGLAHGNRGATRIYASRQQRDLELELVRQAERAYARLLKDTPAARFECFLARAGWAVAASGRAAPARFRQRRRASREPALRAHRVHVVRAGRRRTSVEALARLGFLRLPTLLELCEQPLGRAAGAHSGDVDRTLLGEHHSRAAAGPLDPHLALLLFLDGDGQFHGVVSFTSWAIGHQPSTA
jgi:hypothetical protein